MNKGLVAIIVLAVAAGGYVMWRRSKVSTAGATGLGVTPGAPGAGPGAQAQQLGTIPRSSQLVNPTYASQQAKAPVSPGATGSTVGSTVAVVNQGLGLFNQIDQLMPSSDDNDFPGLDGASQSSTYGYQDDSSGSDESDDSSDYSFG